MQRGRSDATERSRELMRIMDPLTVVGEAELALALKLFEEHEDVGAFDAVLAATAQLAGADALVSADAAFSRLPAPAHRDPAGPEVAAPLKRG